LVQNCVVVGHYQPCIVIFVEPIIPRQDLNAANIIKTDIIARMSSFNAGLFEHEKLRDPCQIVVVTPGALPRTQEKGNIRFVNLLLELFRLPNLHSEDEKQSKRSLQKF